MAAEQVIGAGGAVTLGPLTLSVQELSVRDELRLLKRLTKMAADAMGPGSFWAAAVPVIEWLKGQGRHAEANLQSRVTAEMVAGRAAPSNEAVEQFRQSPPGVVEELFARTRGAHPDVRREELAAVVTEANAYDIYLDMIEAVAPKATTPSDSSN